MRVAVFCLPLAILFVAAACGGDESASNELLVAAAANVQPAFDEMGPLFEEEAGAQVTFSYGSTVALARQIEAGLPADVFVAADVENVDRLREKGLLIDDTQHVYARGRLALASSNEAGVTVSELADLLRPEVEKVAIADPDVAPYGRAAEQALESAGLWDELKPKLVYGQNVNAATEYVRSGNAEAGLVALSLVIHKPDVTYVTLDDSLHQPIEQALALKDTRRRAGPPLRQLFVRGPECARCTRSTATPCLRKVACSTSIYRR
jgi:molybdate transport system substrate-binding protein